jgi:catechol 2,3-dioxygenase-like lactoylglutathione lyase family enzyme
MIIVADIAKSKQFYISVLSQEITLDLGSYVVFEGFSMMSREQWNTLTNDALISPCDMGHNFEMYFEENDLDDFARRLDGYSDIKKFTPLGAAPWGQRTIRFLDPDNHVVEVAESMETVVKRFLSSGMTIKETSEKTMMPVKFVQKCYDENFKPVKKEQQKDR